jgi:hypothetical protein
MKRKERHFGSGNQKAQEQEHQQQNQQQYGALRSDRILL